MILVLCNDDVNILNNAVAQQGGLFGNVQNFINNHTPQLGVNENLFITAHGIQGEIGNANGELGYNATELWNYLTNVTPNGSGRSLFPVGYSGNIYFSCCYSANIVRRDRLSFIENFHALLRVTLRSTNVYGNLGSIGYPILQPNSNQWVQVANI
jgi:hypothetical protein